jgi:hypothetical protein
MLCILSSLLKKLENTQKKAKFLYMLAVVHQFSVLHSLFHVFIMLLIFMKACGMCSVDLFPFVLWIEL